jgi:hypothetical protein
MMMMLLDTLAAEAAFLHGDDDCRLVGAARGGARS